MKMIVNGTLDLAHYIKQGGLKWSFNKVDGPNAGRTQDLAMHFDRLGELTNLDAECRMMTGEELRLVANALRPKTVLLTFDDPMEGEITLTMYVATIPANHVRTRPDGVELWDGMAVQFREA